MIPISSYGAGKLMVIVLLDLRFKTDGGGGRTVDRDERKDDKDWRGKETMTRRSFGINSSC